MKEEAGKNDVIKAKERNFKKKSSEKSQLFRESNLTCHRIFSSHNGSLGVCIVRKTADLVLSFTSCMILGKLLVPLLAQLLHL